MILLDTNIVIYLLNGNQPIAKELNQYAPQDIAISFITVGELIFGAHRSKQTNSNLLRVVEFSQKIEVVHSDDELTGIYGRLKSQTVQQGYFPGDHDLWIAATAILRNKKLITNNERHFKRIEGFILENWLKKTSQSSA